MIETDLAGKVALVTGASRGIGRAIALGFARAGAAVGLVARNAAELEDAAGEIRAAGGRCTTHAADVLDRAAMERAVAHTAETLGGIVDLLVNNAGNNVIGSFKDQDAEVWWQQVEVNIRGTYFVTHAVLPGMLSVGRGRIINISSINGKQGAKFCTAYCTAKHGIIGLTRALALEVAHTPITVNAVCPGWVKTKLTDETFEARVGLMKMSREEIEKGTLRLTPQGVSIEPGEVADAVLFLCSKAAARMTGQSLSVDGGRMVY